MEIQLEDWREDYGVYFIGAYPIAKNSSTWVRGGEPFRLTINTDNARADFDALKTGAKKINEMSNQFYDRKRAMYYLGINPTEETTVAERMTAILDKIDTQNKEV